MSQNTWPVADTTQGFEEQLEDVVLQESSVMFFLDLLTRDQDY